MILQLRDGTEGLSGLMDDASELTAWSSAAGVRVLSIYERSGEFPYTCTILVRCTREREGKHLTIFD